jgi:predicted Zn-dependent peptidase
MTEARAQGISVSVLPSGLVVITEHLPYVRSVALGLAFGVGSRDDPPDRSGMAHLIEHMVFKGTQDRDAVEINIAAESLGAELNAFTDKESTCFYGRFPADQRGPVIDLLIEVVSGPAFRAEELTREKEVVAEEIRTASEDPDTCAVNGMFRAVYGAHPMGSQIAGTHESVARLTEGELRERYGQVYGAGCGVAVAVGQVEHAELADRLHALLNRRNGCRPAERVGPEVASPGTMLNPRTDLSQVYVCLAMPTFAYADPRRHALVVLNTALGGGVSSRLFQRLREREALVYSVASFTESYGDSGLLGIYFVTDRRKLERCLAVLDEELARLRREKLTADEFERARVMTKSSFLLALESPTSRMMRLARAWQMLGRVVSVDETIDAFDRLTRDDVDRLVGELLGQGFGYAGVAGPLTESEADRLFGPDGRQ